jgi:gliding motility-associated-like protein
VIGAAACNNATGSIALTVAGGSGNYSYLWANGTTSASLTGLASGNYYVRVKDNTTQCIQALTVAVPNLTNLAVNGIVTPPGCNQQNGSITTNLTGGVGLYTYNWSNGATTASLTNLQAGVYVLNVTDNASGCTAQKVFNVGETGGPSVSLNITQPGCATNSNGAISVAASGGYSYKWSNGSVLKDQVNLKAGTYAVIVSDTVSGCSSLYTAVLLPKTQMQITASPRSNTACLAAANGAITVSVSGGTAPYAYLWSNGSTVANLLNIAPGNYTLNVQDAGGCSTSVNVPVSTDSSGLLNITLGTVVKASCNTATNGAVNVSVLGGQLPYTYLWSNGATTANLSNVGPGTYTLTVTDVLGCVKQLSATVGIDSTNLLTVTLDSAHAAGCSGSTSGGLYITASGGTGPYTYSWSNGSSVQDLVNITAGSYSVTVADVNHCSVQLSANVPVSNSGNISLTVDSVKKATCLVSGDGKIYVHASGGAAPYTYAWSNGATTASLSNVNPGLYTLTATDANGCPGQVSVTLGIDTALTLKVGLDSLRGAGCATGNSAAIFITPSGGTMPYTYNWSNGTSVQDLQNVVPGTYVVSVTDARGCNVIRTAQVGIDTAKTPKVVIDSVSGAGCIGSSSGSLYITASHGVAPYSFVWSNGAATEDLLNIAPGSYSVTVHDAAGCTAVKSGSVGVDTNKKIIIALDSIVGATCITSHTGGLLVSVSGGRTPYTYAWSNGSTAQDLSNAMTGAYTLLVTDANGCTAQIGANIGVDTARSIHVTAGAIGGAGCQGSPSGSIAVQVNGGTAPYTYAWSNGATAQNITNVPPGSYSLTVTDASGCTKQFNTNVGIDTANKLTAAVQSVTKARCTGSLSGGVDVSVNGGTPPYTYNWSNGATSQDLSYVASGSYSLTVSDAVGCAVQLSVNVGIDASNPVVAAIDSVIGIGCKDSASGQIYASAHGGVAPYVYLWSNGATTEDLLHVTAGSYTLTVTDDAGCKATANASVIRSAAFSLSASVKNISCYGLTDGAVTLTVSGGSGNYQYNWSNGAVTQSVSGLALGNYMLTVTDKTSQCSKTDTFSIRQPDSLSAGIAVTNDGCADGDDGKITLTVSGGTVPYRYAWTNGAVTASLANLAPATYSVTVTDEQNCTKTFAATVGKDSCNFTVVIHDVITPNGDGVNDLWVIEGIENYPNSKVELYNKWGNLVYDKTGYDNRFRGVGNAGTELPDGTYYYVVKLNAPNRMGGKNDFAGFIMINR